MNRRRFIQSTFAASAFVSVLSCAEPNRPDIGPPGISIVSGADRTDTVQSIFHSPLLVEVRDSAGRPRVGQPVLFTGQFDGRGPHTAVGWDTVNFTYGWVDSTDSRGRAGTFVRLETIAGPAHVTATVIDSLGPPDSVRAGFVVLAGRPGQVTIAVPDSSAFVGEGYALGGAVADRFGNARTEPVTYQSLTPTIATVSPAGFAGGVAIGRGAMRVEGAGFADTAWITVPPVGMLAAIDVGDTFAGVQPGLVLVKLDGSGYRRIGPAGELPDWTANGDSLVYGRGDHLRLLDTLGSVDRLFVPTGTLSGEAWASFSPDGRWVFFNGAPNQCQPLYRARSDGSEPVWVGPMSCSAVARASSSPDGSRASVWFGGIGILDVSSGAIDTLIPWVPSPSTNFPPRWSPDGATLAYVRDTHIRLMTPTGLTPLELTPPDSSSYEPLGFKWSPDSQWLVARRSGGLDLIRLQDGLRLPLAWSARLRDPAWRP